MRYINNISFIFFIHSKMLFILFIKTQILIIYWRMMLRKVRDGYKICLKWPKFSSFCSLTIFIIYWRMKPIKVRDEYIILTNFIPIPHFSKHHPSVDYQNLGLNKQNEPNFGRFWINLIAIPHFSKHQPSVNYQNLSLNEQNELNFGHF